jgi:glutathione S-transferase
MHEQLPILYSFRRCPYAIRARLAIKVSRVQVELREVVLADKPKAMLVASPKGTVPVLVLPDDTVIDESRDIMLWALSQHDPEHWLSDDKNRLVEGNALIALNDHEFKAHLDHYKYADRFPKYPMECYRQQGEVFLQQLEARLTRHPFLLGNAAARVDMAILPFVRQFASVDKSWFDQSPYPHLRGWLEKLLASDLFQQVMVKSPQWHEGDEIMVFGGQGQY